MFMLTLIAVILAFWIGMVVHFWWTHRKGKP